jgi:hypothetical protein
MVCVVDDCVGRSRADRAIFSKLFMHKVVYASYVNLVTLFPIYRHNYVSSGEFARSPNVFTLKTVPCGPDKSRNRPRSIIFDRVHDRFSVQPFISQFECIAQFVRLLG